MALVAVVTLELAARVDDWVHFDAPLFGNYDFDQLFRVTDEGLRGVPHGRYLRWHLNADGLNGPETQPDAGQTRILVYGASEAFGIYEDSGKEFPRALETVLNHQPEPVRFEVINAGIPGMRVGSGLSLPASSRPDFTQSDRHLSDAHSLYWCHPALLRQAATQTGVFVLRVAGVAPDRQVKRGRQAGPAKVPDNAPARCFDRLESAGHEHIDRVAAASLSAFETDLGCVVKTSRELGMIPVLVTHANRFDHVAHEDDADRLTEWRKQYPELSEGGFVDLEDRANGVVRKVADQDGIALVDADRSLSGHAEWFADHAHFNNEGSAQMGALLAPAVLAANRASPR